MSLCSLDLKIGYLYLKTKTMKVFRKDGRVFNHTPYKGRINSQLVSGEILRSGFEIRYKFPGELNSNNHRYNTTNIVYDLNEKL